MRVMQRSESVPSWNSFPGLLGTTALGGCGSRFPGRARFLFPPAHFDIVPGAEPRKTKLNLLGPDAVAGDQDCEPICPFGTQQLPKAEWREVNLELESIIHAIASGNNIDKVGYLSREIQRAEAFLMHRPR